MKVEYNSGYYSLDSLYFTINGVEYMITGTIKITDVYGSWYRVDFKNIKTGEKFEINHNKLCQKIMKHYEN